MKEVTLKIPEKRINFFMELIRQLGFEVSRETEVPEEHKQEVRKRIVASDRNPERLLDWNDVKNDFKLINGL